MGLSRNKVAVSEGAAGSPPFYGDREADHARRDRDFVVKLGQKNLLWEIEIEKRNPMWGCSSVGRAPALQAGGQEFESLHLHRSCFAASKVWSADARQMIVP